LDVVPFAPNLPEVWPSLSQFVLGSMQNRDNPGRNQKEEEARQAYARVGSETYRCDM
jgi:hypothetical protein